MYTFRSYAAARKSVDLNAVFRERKWYLTCMMLAKAAFVLWLSEFAFINSHLSAVTMFVSDRSFLDVSCSKAYSRQTGTCGSPPPHFPSLPLVSALACLDPPYFIVNTGYFAVWIPQAHMFCELNLNCRRAVLK